MTSPSDFMEIERRKILEVMLLAVVLILSFNQIYRVHYGYTGMVQDPHGTPNYMNVTDFSYPYPIHADEWTHLAQAVYIMDTGTLGFVNPYSSRLYYHQDLEIGYHIFLAMFFTVTDIDPVLGYQYLPALFFVINSAFMFLLVRRFTKNYYIALLSILFFLAVPSNTNIMGNWFAVPMTFSLFMVYAFFMMFGEFTRGGELKYLLFSVVAYCISAVTYPPAAMLISLIVMVQLLMRIRIGKKDVVRKNMMPITGSCLMAMALLLILVNFPEYSVLNIDWTSFQYDYSLILFYGVIPTFLAVIGALVTVEKKLDIALLIWPSLFLLNLLSYSVTDTGFFFPYERSVYYLLVGLIPLAAIGFFHVLEKVHDTSGSIIRTGYGNQVSMALVLIMLLLTLGVMFQNYYGIDERKLVLLHVLENQDYEAIKFIGDSYGTGNIILADSLVSLGTYPISRNHAIAIMPSNLGHGDTTLFSVFVASTCSEKFGIIYNENIDFVLSMLPMNCEFMEEVYSDGDYVYRVTE